MAVSNEISIKITGTSKQLEAACKAAAASVSSMEKNISGSGSAAKNAANGGYTVLKNVVANLATSVVQNTISGLKSLATTVVSTGKDFDSAMSKVSAVSGATGSELDALRQKAKEMGASTKFTASEAADAFNYMAMAGWKTGDMLDGISGIMNLAAASGSDLATTSDIVTDALTAFGLSAADSGRFADVLAAASSNANTNVEMMGATFKYAAPVAGALGYSIEDTAVAIGLMANAGIKADQAGTSLRSIMQRLASDTGGAATAAKALGVEISNADGSMRPLSDVTSELRTAFSKLSQEEKVNAAKTIAGANAMSGLLAIVNSSDADFEKLTSAVNNSSGAAENMANTMLDNLGGALTILKSEWEATTLALYEGDMTGFFTNLGKVLKDVGKLIVEAMPTIVDGLMSVIDAVAQDVPQMLIQIAPVIMNGILDVFNYLMMNAGMLVQSLIDLFLQVANTVIERLPEIFTSVVDGIMGVLITLSEPQNLQLILQAALTLLLKIVEAIPQMITSLANCLPTIIDNIITFLTDPATIGMIFEAAVQLFFALVTAVPQILGSLVGALGSIFESAWNAITGIFSGAGEWFGNIFQGAWDGIKNIFSAVGGFFSGIWNTITSIFSVVKDWFRNMFQGAVDNIKNVFSVIGGFFSNIWNGIKNVFSGTINFFKNIFQGAWNAITGIFSNLANFFGNIFSNAWNAVKNVFSTGGRIFAGIVEGIGNLFRNIVNAIIGGINKVVAITFNAINGFLDTLRGINILGITPFGWIGSIGVPQIPTLATGGIIPGNNYSGDRVLARVNSGEMVMNGSQQQMLWDAIQNGEFGGGSSTNVTVNIGERAVVVESAGGSDDIDTDAVAVKMAKSIKKVLENQGLPVDIKYAGVLR